MCFFLGMVVTPLRLITQEACYKNSVTVCSSYEMYINIAIHWLFTLTTSRLPLSPMFRVTVTLKLLVDIIMYRILYT